jgi:hypothetical protein
MPTEKQNKIISSHDKWQKELYCNLNDDPLSMTT